MKFLKLLIIMTVVSLFKSFASEIPKFAKNKYKAETVASMPQGHFFENIAVGKNKDMYITDYTGKSIYRYTKEGGLSLFTKVQGHPVSIRFSENGKALIAVHKKSILDGPDFVEHMALYKMEEDGKLFLFKEVSGAKFLNGMTLLGDEKFLIGDSIEGVIWLADLKTNQIKKWLSDDLFLRGDEKSHLPGINGLQKVGNVIYASNSDKAIIMKIPLDKNDKPGKPEIMYKNITADDIEIGESGAIYVTTHKEDILKVNSDGKVEIIAGKLQEAEGSTAVKFGSSLGDDEFIYVVTDGGLFFGENIGARLIKIKVNDKASVKNKKNN